MLRITEAREGPATTLRVEGKVRGAEVLELIRACEPHLGATRELVLDLGQVSFVDEPGAMALRELMDRGVKVRSCSPFVAGLLEEARG